MKKYLLLGVVLAGASLSAPGAMAAMTDGLGQPGIVRLAQMDSPGDGLDGRRAVREGNARPYRLGSMGDDRRGRLRRRHAARRHPRG